MKRNWDIIIFKGNVQTQDEVRKAILRLTGRVIEDKKRLARKGA